MLRLMCALWLVSFVSVAGAPGPASLAQKSKPKPAALKTASDVNCPADLGKGAKSKRDFCDIAVGTDPAAGIVMRVPPHTGATTLRFDLHNRFPVSGTSLPFARAAALVAVLNGNSGAVIDRAAVLGELRTEVDLFDRLVGAGPGGSKTVAPGRAQSVKITVPASVTSISIVGVRLEITNKDGRAEYATQGRPVAIASNLRIEYTPATVNK
jgi:hypothetical protein